MMLCYSLDGAGEISFHLQLIAMLFNLVARVFYDLCLGTMYQEKPSTSWLVIKTGLMVQCWEDSAVNGYKMIARM